jgi:hypothetical protein
MYNRGKYLVTTGGVIWGTTDVRALLIVTSDNGALPSAAWNPDLNTVADLLAVSNVDEASGTGYSRKIMAGFVITEDDTNDWVVFDANDLVWAGLSAGTVRAVITYKHNASDASAELISIHDTGFPQVSGGSDLTVKWPTTGVVTAV